jgi:hypothetical protein
MALGKVSDNSWLRKLVPKLRCLCVKSATFGYFCADVVSRQVASIIPFHVRFA